AAGGGPRGGRGRGARARRPRSHAPAGAGVAPAAPPPRPPAPDPRHIRSTVSLQRRLGVLRDMLRSRKTLDFDDAFGSEDRFTQAVTLFALLELHRRGEATWAQKETFGRIEVHANPQR